MEENEGESGILIPFFLHDLCDTGDDRGMKGNPVSPMSTIAQFYCTVPNFN